MFWIPMAVGAAAGALTNKDNPLKGAALGGTLGSVTGGLGGLGGAAAGSAGGAAGGAGAAGAAGLGVDAAYLGGASAGPGAMSAGLSVAPGYTGGGAAGLLSSSNLKTMGDMAGLAQQAGVFGGQQAPAAPSAGIPARQADFTGLLSAGRGQQMSGAEKLMAQRAARRG